MLPPQPDPFRAAPGSSPPGPPVLSLRGVRKGFGGVDAVAGVELDVSTGEYLCILGPSGSGKSTLLRLVAGFEIPDAGEVHLAGVRVDRLPPEDRDVHTVFQGYALFPHLTVLENVAFGLRMRRIPGAEARRRAGEALVRVGLAGFGERRPPGLSGGEQQRVALARALVNGPPLLLLDEPLSALDRKLRMQMQEELRRIQRESGIAFLHVTHDQEEAMRLGDRVVVMNRGRILQEGAPAEVYRRPRSRFVADFLGSANLLRGRVVGAPPRLVLEGGGELPFAAPLPGRDPRPLVAGEPAGGWALRPEALRLVDPEAQVPPGEVRVAARMVSCTTLGALDEVRVVLPGGTHLRVHRRSAGDPTPLPGAAVELALDPLDLVPLEE